MIKWLLTRAVEDDNVANGYDLVYTPNVTKEELFKISGHLPLYAANQYPPMAAGAGESEDVRYRVKPMNCPMHALIYKSQQRSYRDLPLRLSEVANVYRNEKSGTLHGLLRVRGLSMDDAHIFCTMDQVEDEIFLCLDQVDRLVRATFGFELDFEVSTRPEERLGGDEVWDRAEAILKRALERKGIPYRIDEGGGAFYGPKIDIKFKDAIGRIWQGPTIQLDFNLPERFELEYTGPDNRPHRPVMIHRAIYGTLERFTGNLIEHFAGRVPGLARPGAGPGHPDLGRAERAGPRARRAAQGRRAPGARGRPLGDAQLPDPRGRDAEGALHGRHRAAGGRQRQPRSPGAGGGEEAGGHARGRVPGADRRGGAEPGAGAVTCHPERSEGGHARHASPSLRSG